MEEKNIDVLLIEDDKVDQMAFQRLIRDKKLKYNAVIAASITEGVANLNKKKFDVVITDFLLSDGNAFDIFSNCPDTPIIVTTGAGNEEIAITAMKKGAYDYLIKDHDLNYLKVLPVTVERAIQRKKDGEKFRMLSYSLMSISDSVYITDMTGKIIFANKSFFNTYGYGDEILGENCTILIWKDPVSKDGEISDMAQKTISSGEFLHKKKDGTKFPVSLSKSILKDENGKEEAIIGVARNISEKKQAEEEREKLITKLQEALDKVKIMRGMLPICASCKKIRDDKGYWNQLEAYIRDHSDAEFSHSICPGCLKKLYPELYGEE